MKNFEFYVIGLRDNNPEPYAFFSEEQGIFLYRFSRLVSVYMSKDAAEKAKKIVIKNTKDLEDNEEIEVYKIYSTIIL